MTQANSMSDRPDTELEMARRHVREGGERIARLEAIVAALERNNHPTAAARGRNLLETMLSILDTQRRHLREIEKRNLGHPLRRLRTDRP